MVRDTRFAARRRTCSGRRCLLAHFLYFLAGISLCRAMDDGGLSRTPAAVLGLPSAAFARFASCSSRSQIRTLEFEGFGLSSGAS